MKKFLLGTVALIALGATAPAFAADLPARTYTKAPPMIVAIYDWSGFYIGANGGWGSLSDKWTLGANELGSHDSTGGVAGGQIGYRWQAASWVFGLEAQGNWADLSGSHTQVGWGTWTDNSKLKAFGLFTGQVGYAWNSALLYVKGGAAVTSTKYHAIDTLTGLTAMSSNDQTRWGGAVGVGLEYGFAPNWSVAAEYDHLFTGRKDTDLFNPNGTLNGTYRLGGDVDLVTARLNYRWGGPVVAKY
jgi:outer membrane immunogenic protein